MEIIKALENNASLNVTIVGSVENPLFKASDIGEILGMVKIRNVIQDYDITEKVMHTIKTPGGPQKVNFLTTKGLKKIICNTRKPNAIDLAKQLNIDMNDTFYIPIETSTIHFIQNIYKEEDFIHQYIVNPYRIDLYSQKYKLAIECDEHFHIFQKDDDIKREEYIKKKLGCKFIRFSPNKKLEYLSDLVYKINKVIEDYKLDDLRYEIVRLNTYSDIYDYKKYYGNDYRDNKNYIDYFGLGYYKPDIAEDE